MKSILNKRVERLRSILEKSNANGFLISNVKNIFYLTGFLGGSRLLVLRDQSILQVPRLDFDLAENQAENCQLEQIERNGGIDSLTGRLEKSQMKKVFFDFLDSSNYIELTKTLKNIKFLRGSELLWNLRKVKDDKELEILRKAANITDRGLERAYEVIGLGIPEYEVAAEIEYAMRKMGSNGTAFDTIVASGPNSAFPHGGCSDRRIKDGDPIILDVGAKFRGYNADLSRSIVVGESSNKIEELFGIVADSQNQAIEAMKGGVRACDIDSIARDIIAKKGYGNHFVHGLGHGVGLDIHEPPLINSKNVDVLREGNVVTVEPGIYIIDFGGIRIEDTVLIKECYVEKLTGAPYRLNV